MAKNILQLNYDELGSIAKKFKDEGEDTLNLYASTRQRVRDLHKEWIGDAAEKFFDEMETELLPALQRLSKALHFSQDVANDIMKIVHEADEDTTGYFKGDFSRDDFGADAFRGALGGSPGGQGGPDDFGAGRFNEAVGGLSGGAPGSDDFGAGKFEEATPQQGKGEGGGDHGSSSEKSGQEESAETEPATGGGGGGSSSSSEGLKGDLKNLGVGTGQVQQSASAGGANSGGVMTDHIYSGGGASDSGGDSPSPTDSASSASSEQPSTDGSGAAAAGAAGAAGAGGAAVRSVKGRKKKKN